MKLALYKIRLTLLLGLALLGSFFMVSLVNGQDADLRGKQAFQEQGEIPWYDRETDSIRFRELPDNSVAPQQNPNRGGQQAQQRQGPQQQRGGGSGLGGGGAIAGGGVAAVFFWIFIAFVFLLFIGGLIWAFLKIESKEKSPVTETKIEGPAKESGVERLPFQINKPFGDLLSAAREYFNKGDYRNAMIHLYSHVLVSLDERGLIRLTRGKTNRQYLNEIRRHGPVADYLESCMIPFEEAFFGARDPMQSTVSECFNQFDQFKNSLSQTTAVG